MVADLALVEAYGRALREIHFSGMAVKETSSYPALRDLLNGVGEGLKPKVRCILQLSNRGAGFPDGGLFTVDQIKAGEEQAPLFGLVPARGVIEVKGLGDDVVQIAGTEQVRRYLTTYDQVLVTNYRDFLLVTRADGAPLLGERFTLAADEKGFWRATLDPRSFAAEHGERFVEYLRRVLLHRALLADPKDVAFFLASYARDARARIARRGLPGLVAVRSALEEALGLRFEGEKGEHFFRSTLVQTLFYGMFSAWVLWVKKHPRGDDFDWRRAVWDLEVPAVRALFEEVAKPSSLEPLNLVEVLDWTGTALNRVDRASFFARFEEDHAVQYFYEPFLEAFDPELRKELGVWYTPREVVEYMVARVDTVLREELAIPDGLADPRVHVLDPCTGTGSYLVAVLKRIARTLREQGDDALLAHDLKQAALTRVHGFEILPAPFVVAHLQLGLLLQSLGAPLAEHGRERASVYLTNALTGWEPPTGAKLRLPFPELEAERDAAERVKRDTPILVVIGNPPYNAFAGVSPQEEAGLVEPYKVGLNKPVAEGGWGIRKFNLDDLYVRFFRLAERRIADQTGRGIVCYVSNFSYLSDPSYVVMRQRFLSEFDALWFDSLNGDSRETGKLTPDGRPDPSIFSTEYNREGIRVGTAIGLMVRKTRRDPHPTVRYREFWGVTKRADLVASLDDPSRDREYDEANPDATNRFSFRPSAVASHYLDWPLLIDLCAESPSNGLMEKRGGALIDIDPAKLDERMREYFDSTVTWEQLEALGTGLTRNAAGFDARKTRSKVLAAESFSEARILRYLVRPFDSRWCYFSSVPSLWNRARPTLREQCWEGNSFVLSRMRPANDEEGAPFYFVRGLSDDHLLAPDASCFPLRLSASTKPSSGQNPGQISLSQLDGAAGSAAKANLAAPARAYLASLGITDPDADAETAGLIWMHALAIGYAPAYLAENADGIRQDWPRIPLPAARETLLASAALGRQVAALLDPETPVRGVTTGTIRPDLRRIAVPARVGGGALDPEAGDLALTAGWGHRGKGGVTMPGHGKFAERPYTADERAAIAAWNNPLGLDTAGPFNLLGETTKDIFLNDRAWWSNVPRRVWGYTIGGYQVIKKWLSYREEEILGRSLRADEMRYVQEMARRIAAILLLEPKLDANYRAVTAATYAWPSQAAPTASAVPLW